MDLHAAIDIALAELRRSARATGTVSGTSGTKVVVAVSGGTLTLPRLASYTPTVGDVVVIDTLQPGAWLVLGKPA
ncbi:hypothetical protein GCM10022243_48070 [Saccharothrix violaceirubra]|uniref:Uncharacterized protein n=1 Tax=Saccharothrix violaceirubra TaxID=413306 RepID=A0A7W7T028_9PSEU|nr:hypothetical protein [Saccharothrix violaceirubra]MBB4963851.1 hypothetical protein [Saccharothrix violaceirubra]